MAYNNVQNIKFLRNGTLFNNHDAAYKALSGFTLTAEQDGTAILARYTAEDNKVKTLVGWVYSGASGSHVTIQDIEGASADVEALRTEINNKLGTGVTSANTATAQLAALSGSTASTSADTSVEGAKRYADELISELDYSGVTTGDGVYVTNVTEADGKIAATTATLPSVTDTAVAKSFVTSVSENNGEISSTKGTITSSGKTIVLTDNANGGINFEANVDGTTIIVDENTGVMSVASSALVQYEGDGKTVQISAVQNGVRTVSSPLTISATTPSEANVKEQYNLVNASGETVGATIKIYKDSALLSVALLHADTTSTPKVLPTYDKATDTWTDIPATAQTEANQALCYAYEDVSGNTVVAAVPVGSFINEQEFASGITWDSTANKVKGVVDPQSDNFLTVGADGFKLSGVQDAIDAAVGTAVSGLDATVSAETAHVSVKVDEVDGKLTAVTLTESDIANATDLAGLSGKTITVLTSANESISIGNGTAQDDGTIGIDIKTDASKIKMTGFTADTSGFTAITSASTVTEAVKAIETAFLDNEEIVSSSLNDLNTRLNTVSGDVETVSGKVETVSGDVETLKTNYVSGVTVNGTGVTVSNHVAPIVIESATSATTATSTEAITIQTANDGTITLGLSTIDCGTY